MMRSRQNSWSSVPQSVRDRLRRVVFERDGLVCKIRLPGCTGAATEVDHIRRRADGGAVLDVNNMRASCAHCNRSRGAVTPGVKFKWPCSTPREGHPPNTRCGECGWFGPSRNWVSA